MRLLELESSRWAYRADFVLYGLAVAGLTLATLTGTPTRDWPLLAAVMVSGYLLWGLLEYLLHRFVLHGLQPFRGMHEQHHQRPQERLGTPTVVSAPLFAALVFLPAWGLLGLWPACALMTGVLAAYLAYSITHHLCHHGLGEKMGKGAWLARRQRWHARHHVRVQAIGCYGVSQGFWDYVFGTARTSFVPLKKSYRPFG
jgi:sterol desaturase/sphingolipid hydroxylase (fatty acid hydroxylase superfamily)